MSSVFPQEKLLSDVEAENPAALHDYGGIGSGSLFNRLPLLNRLLAALLLIPGLPIIGLLVLITKMGSPGPGIYRQRRVGYRGHEFTVFKIRTMRTDAETKTGPVWCTKQDPRVTRVGAVFRKLHLDEFPQLFNVLRGEMVFVGPRPERPEFTAYLAREIPAYCDRLAVRPGITGLAQILLPPDTDVEGVRKKLAVDLHYIKTANLFVDLRIVLCTSLRLLGLSGMKAAGFMGLKMRPEMFRDIELYFPEEESTATSETKVAANGKTVLIDGRHDAKTRSAASANGVTAGKETTEVSAASARSGHFA